MLKNGNNITIVDLRICTSFLNAAINITIEQNQLSMPVDKEICTWNNQQIFTYLSRLVSVISRPSRYFRLYIICEISQKRLIVNMLYVKLHPPFYYNRIVARKNVYCLCKLFTQKSMKKPVAFCSIYHMHFK